MEFLAGESLSAAIAAGPMPLRARARRSCARSCAALEHAHAAGVVHRDLKPENIMLVERDGQRDVVKILDFGIAKVTQPQSGGEALTQAGVIFGTPEYLSPEQALGEAVDARADIYAAGIILYEMLAGRRPFEIEDKVKIISMHLSHAPPRDARRQPGGRLSARRSSRRSCRRWTSRARTGSRPRPRSCARSTTRRCRPRRRRRLRRRAADDTAQPARAGGPARRRAPWRGSAAAAWARSLGAVVLVGGFAGGQAQRASRRGAGGSAA